MHQVARTVRGPAGVSMLTVSGGLSKSENGIGCFPLSHHFGGDFDHGQNSDASPATWDRRGRPRTRARTRGGSTLLKSTVSLRKQQPSSVARVVASNVQRARLSGNLWEARLLLGQRRFPVTSPFFGCFELQVRGVSAHGPRFI